MYSKQSILSKLRDESAPEVKLIELPKEQLHKLDALNFELFRERRIINRTSHSFLVVLAVFAGDIPVGFKIGYGRKEREFYSAKGGVLPDFRRRGFAESMLIRMMDLAADAGYNTFTYDTFPNMNRGMLILGLNHGFEVSYAGYNTRYSDYQITLTKKLVY